ncbi:unnamed protein product [Prunus brigantina]
MGRGRRRSWTRFCGISKENTKYEAKEKLRWLKQTGSVKDYVATFTNLLFEVPSMTDEDKLMYFMSGLQNWAKLELQRRHVQTLSEAIAAAESLVEFKKKDQGDSKFKGRKDRSGSGGGDNKPKEGSKSGDKSDGHKSSWKKNDKGDKEKDKSKLPCYLCDGAHMMRDCPQKKAFNAMNQEKEEKAEREAGMGAIHRFNALQAKGAQPQVQAKGVMFVDAMVNGKTTRCLVDTGASHNFMSVQEAKRLGCRVSKEAGSMKTVNSTAIPIDGVARGVELHIATWKGVADFSVISMDDYDVVLGMEFMDKKKGEPTFLATMKMDIVGKEVQPVPKAVEAILKEFADVMPKELPKTLPPRREWTPRCQHAFDELKRALMEELVLRLPDLSKPFERIYVPRWDNLRHYVSANQRDWAKLLDVAQFSYNLQLSESTGSSPFELATGQQPMTPNTVVSGYKGSSPAAYKTAKEWQVNNELAQAQLEKATRKMKKWADKHRRDVVFQPGDLVFVKLNPSQHKSTRKLHKALLRRYEGPFPIIRSVGRAAYRVGLPPRLKIHPVFHVSNLKPYHADPEEPSRGESQRAPPLMVTSFDREVECIMAKREVRRKGVPRYFEYFVKWKGLPESEGNWEKEESLWKYKDIIEAFDQEGSTAATRTSPD